MNEKRCLQTNLVVQICSKAEILHTIAKTGCICSKMLPKRQQKRKIGQKRAVNVAKKATFTGLGTIELN